WETAGGKRARELGADNRGEVRAVDFSRDSKTLVSQGLGGDLVFWDVASGRVCRKLPPAGERFKGFGFRAGPASDGRLVGTTADDGLYLWETGRGRKLHHLPAGHLMAGGFSPDGLVVASAGDQVRVWDADTGQELGRLPGGIRPHHHYFGLPVVFSPDGPFLAVPEIVDADGVLLWDVDSDKGPYRLDGDQGKVPALTFSPDGKTLLTAG